MDHALDRWHLCRLRADNTSIVTVMLDPPGPPRAQVLRKLHGLPASVPSAASPKPPALPPKPKQQNNGSGTTSSQNNKGIAIISRFPNSKREEEKEGMNLVSKSRDDEEHGGGDKGSSLNTRIVHDSTKSTPQKLKVRSTSVPTVTSLSTKMRDLEYTKTCEGSNPQPCLLYTSPSPRDS